MAVTAAYTCATREAACNFLSGFFRNVGSVNEIRVVLYLSRDEASGVLASGCFDVMTSATTVSPDFSLISSGIKTLPLALSVRYLTAPLYSIFPWQILAQGLL